MVETQPELVKPEPVIEDQSFDMLLKDLLGKTVTVVNAESYEHAPVGYTLKTGFYRAKITGMGRDYLIILTEMKKGKGEGDPVKQYLPICHIKRVSLMKTERLLHI